MDDPLDQRRRAAFGFELDQPRDQGRLRDDPADAESRCHQLGKGAEVKDDARAIERLQERLVLAVEADASIGTVLENRRSEEHTSELQSLMRISYAVFCLKKKNNKPQR